MDEAWEEVKHQKRKSSKKGTTKQLSREGPKSNEARDFLATHKTELCAFAGKNCPRYKEGCNQAHKVHELRRNPYEYDYGPEACPEFDDGSCPRGNHCRYSHTQNETLFHPKVYKTRFCKEAASCPRGRLCAYAHNDEEKREGYSEQSAERTFHFENFVRLESLKIGINHPQTTSQVVSQARQKPMQQTRATDPGERSSPLARSPWGLEALATSRVSDDIETRPLQSAWSLAQVSMLKKGSGAQEKRLQVEVHRILMENRVVCKGETLFGPSQSISSAVGRILECFESVPQDTSSLHPRFLEYLANSGEGQRLVSALEKRYRVVISTGRPPSTKLTVWLGTKSPRDLVFRNLEAVAQTLRETKRALMLEAQLASTREAYENLLKVHSSRSGSMDSYLSEKMLAEDFKTHYLLPLETDSKDWLLCAGKFRTTVPEESQRIVSIRQLVSPRQLKHFLLHKKFISDERWLFHGTTTGSIEGICVGVR